MIGALSVIGLLLAGLVSLLAYTRWFYVPDKQASNQSKPTDKEDPWKS